MAKFIPRDRKARRKRDRRSQNEVSSDTNAVEILPITASEKENKKRVIKDSIRAQQPKMSSKKSKRLDKYIVRQCDLSDLSVGSRSCRTRKFAKKTRWISSSSSRVMRLMH